MRVQMSGMGGVVILLLGGILLGACANPQAPSGGPRDQTPPSIVKTRPVQDTVNVSTETQSIRVEFSEYIERSTLPQSLSITPQLEGRLRYDWSGRSVAIELPTTLRDSTTYIFSFDTNLKDAREGVALNRPITIAFSTGPRINQGELAGRVVGPKEAEPQPRVSVFAYGLSDTASSPPAPLPKQPDYRTQTGEKGTFSFDYLREQRYYVVALRDNNRNRRPDPSEAFAVPPHPALAADSGHTELPVPWLFTKTDTLAPRLQQVRGRSRERLQLNFSEPIRLGSRTPSDWALRDSVADAPVPVRAVYRPAGRPNAVVVRTAPMDSTRHHLPLDSNLVTDTLGNGAVADTARLKPPTRADTTQTRFQAFVPEGDPPDTTNVYALAPGMQPGVRFNQAPDSSTLRAALALRDTAGREQAYTLTTDDGRTYRMQPASPLRPDPALEMTVDGRVLAGPDTTYRRRVRRLSEQEVGALEGRVVRADTTHPAVRSSPAVGAPALSDTIADPETANASVVVELIPTESAVPLDPRTQTVRPGSTFVFTNLPKGTFRFRAFLDRNENGRWDGGRLRPFRRAEPITWSASATESRLRWTSVLSAPLRLPMLRAASRPPPDSAESAPPRRGTE